MSLEDYRENCNDYAGYCANCDDVTRHCSTEPDAENYPCPDCKRDTCMGIEQALLLGFLDIR